MGRSVSTNWAAWNSTVAAPHCSYTFSPRRGLRGRLQRAALRLDCEHVGAQTSSRDTKWLRVWPRTGIPHSLSVCGGRLTGGEGGHRPSTRKGGESMGSDRTSGRTVSVLATQQAWLAQHVSPPCERIRAVGFTGAAPASLGLALVSLAATAAVRLPSPVQHL